MSYALFFDIPLTCSTISNVKCRLCKRMFASQLTCLLTCLVQYLFSLWRFVLICPSRTVFTSETNACAKSVDMMQEVYAADIFGAPKRREWEEDVTVLSSLYILISGGRNFGNILLTHTGVFLWMGILLRMAISCFGRRRWKRGSTCASFPKASASS